MNAPIADTTCIQGHVCSYTIPANTFRDDDNEIMTYTMVGATTPFSTFTAATRTFNSAANVMNTVGSTPLTLQVCDKNNACITDDFNVVVTANTAPAPGTLTNQVWARDTVQSYTFPVFTDA